MRGPLSADSVVAGLYAILDFPLRHDLPPGVVLDAMLAGGAQVVQLRAKHAPLERELVADLAARCHAAGRLLIINDDLALAELNIPGVAGVHLGQSDLPALGRAPGEQRTRRRALRDAGILLGVSTHEPRQLIDTIDALAPDYVGYGPVFATSSKQNPDPVVGLAGLSQACHGASVPVVAIGGISSATVTDVARAGAAAFAVIGALAAPTSEEICERARALSRAFAAAR